jgi:hypothetical protein
MEIDRHDDDSDLSKCDAVKTFAVSRSRSFRMVRLRQTGLNHGGNNSLFLDSFELFGSVAGLE